MAVPSPPSYGTLWPSRMAPLLWLRGRGIREQGMALGIRTGLTYLEHIQNRSSRAAEAFLRMLRRVEPVMDAATFTEALCTPATINPQSAMVIGFISTAR